MVFFLKPSSFKIGCLLVLALALTYLSFAGNKPKLLAALDNRLIDSMFTWRGPLATTGQIVIVDIDDRSLQELGQWPWPRNLVGKLAAKISNGGAKSFGFDMVFPEKDRTSPCEQLPALASLFPDFFTKAKIKKFQTRPELNNDLIMGDILEQTPSISGYVFRFADDGMKNTDQLPFPSAIIRTKPVTSFEQINMMEAYRAIVNIEEVAMAESEGFFNVFPDSSGTIRQAPLFISLDNIPYPSLALEVLRVGLAEKELTIHLSSQIKNEKKGIIGISVAGRQIPTNDQGQISINFRGPDHTFFYISAVDVIQGKTRVLQDKFVLIGTSAKGLGDLRATPFSSAFPGVEVHATIIDNILAADPLSHDMYSETGMTFTLVIIGGLFLTVLLAFSTPLAGGLGGILLILIIICGNYYLFFLNNKILGLTYPLLSNFIIFLAVTLSNYFFEGRKKRFLHNAFAHYVPPAVVDKIVRTPSGLALNGEVKIMTVFFSDIRDFTSISEKLDPDQLSSFMNEYLTIMSDIILSYNGTVDKFIGDAIMAMWGAPLDDEEHAANAVRASLQMMTTLKELQQSRQKRNLPKVDIGIGLNSGEMRVGNFGSLQRFDYTVIGDNVNLASRLEGLNKTYGTNILISAATRQELGDKFICRPIDVVRVKGKEIPVKIYEPLKESKGDELLAEVELFKQAFDYYQARNFTEAKIILTRLQQDRPCKLYSLYLERITAFVIEPPPPDWDGVCTFTTK
jgi:adenylate cyclase